MKTRTFFITTILALATTPAWACGGGDPTFLILLMALAMGGMLLLLGISLVPAFILAFRSRSRARWGAFALGSVLAGCTGMQFGPMLPWDSFFVALIGLWAMMSGAGVVPGLVLERLRGSRRLEPTAV